MSNLNARRSQLRLIEECDQPPQQRRIGTIAVVLLLLIAAVVGAAELQLLPTYSADDVGSILFEAG